MHIVCQNEGLDAELARNWRGAGIKLRRSKGFQVVLSEIDRKLLERCLDRESRAWEAFVDRFLGLVIHVIRHSAQSRMIELAPQDVEDLAADVFLAIVADDFALLRRFRGEASLATYLTVISRRIAVRELAGVRFRNSREVEQRGGPVADPENLEKRITDRDEVERLLRGLNGNEADVVRMYHLEGRSYEEISSKVGMPANSVGPTLSRAREKMKQNGVDA